MIYTSTRLESKHKEMWQGFSVDWTRWPIFDNLDCISFGILSEISRKKWLKIFTKWKKSVKGAEPCVGRFKSQNRSFWIIYTRHHPSPPPFTQTMLSWRPSVLLELSFAKILILGYGAQNLNIRNLFVCKWHTD